jgi:hypothetical protein
MYYEAVFKPSKNMKYSQDAKDLDGKRIAVQEGWLIEEGPYKGQNCFYIPNSTVGWIPKSDLKELKPISFAKWKAINASLGFEN